MEIILIHRKGIFTFDSIEQIDNKLNLYGKGKLIKILKLDSCEEAENTLNEVRDKVIKGNYKIVIKTKNEFCNISREEREKAKCLFNKLRFIEKINKGPITVNNITWTFK